MARLALSVVGGILGAIFIPGVGSSLGFALGSLAGGIIGQLAFPGKGTHVYGPRLNDMQVSGSAPGTVIPLLYGSMRLGGQIIWSGGINEVKTTTSQSAKGGPSVTQTTYTYFCSFAAAFCQGPATIGRIWGDSKLIYNKGGNNYKGVWSSSTTYAVGDVVSEGTSYWKALQPSTNQNPSNGTLFGLVAELFWEPTTAPVNPSATTVDVSVTPTMYQGDETQLPDPLMVSHDGAASVPGYRGTCYAVWEKFPLANFGNRLPNIRAEVHANASSQPETVLEGFQSPHDTNPPGWITISPDGKTMWAVQQQNFSNQDYTYIERYDLITNTVTASGFINGMAAFGYVSGPDWTCQAQPIADANGYLWCPGRASATGSVIWKVDGKTFAVVGKVQLIHGPGNSGTVYNTPQYMSLDATGTTLAATGNASTWSGLFAGGMATYTIDTAKCQVTGVYFYTNQYATSVVQSLPIYDENNNIYLLMVNGDVGGTPDNTGWSVYRINTAGGGSQVVPMPSGYNYDGFIFSDVAPVIQGPAGVNPGAMLYDQTDHTLILFFYDGHMEKWDLNTATRLVTTATGLYYTNGGTTIGVGFGIMANAVSAGTGSNASNNPAQFAFRGKVQNGIFITSGTTNSKFILQAWNASTLQKIAQYDISTWPDMTGGDAFNVSWAFEPLSDSMMLIVSNRTSTGYPSTFPYAHAVYRLFLDRVNGAGQQASAIVMDICTRAGIAVSNIDTSLIQDIYVTGYPIPQLQSGKDMINNLGQAFFFEGRETNFTLQFVPRGQASVATLQETELGLMDDKASLEEKIGQEQDLPKEVEIIYIDQAQDYQQNKQHKIRHHKVRKTTNKTSISLPIVMSARQAEYLADQILWTADLERRSYKTNLWKAYWLLLDPCDVINFNYHGLQLTGRVANMTLGQNQAIALEVIAEDNNSYLSAAAGNSNTGFVGQTIAGLAGTQLWVLDTPYLRDADADATGNTGFYAILLPSSGGSWPAGALYKSSDGETWTQLDASSTQPTYGICTTSLPAPLYSAYSWDYVSTVTIRMSNGAPASDSVLNVLNGSNGVVLYPSLEILQFQTATDNGDGTFTLSNLLRGRRGTEWACGAHVAGEYAFFVNLGGVLHEQTTQSNIGAAKTYKGVTIGQDVGTGTPQSVTLVGRDLMPYAPSHFQGTVDGSHNINLTWIRRTRLQGEWMNGGNTPGTYGVETGMPVPLNEETESYDVEIMKVVGGVATVIRTFSGLTSPSLQYTSAQQVVDFGSNQTSLHARVYQNSAVVGRGFVTDTLNVLGGLAPVGGGSDATSIQGIPVSATAPTDGQVLTYVAANSDVEWKTPTGGSGAARSTYSKTTGSLANNFAETGTINIAKAFIVLNISADRDCRVQLYETAALRDADAGRAAGVTPTGQHGVIADVSLGSDLTDSFIVSGGVGANMEGTVSTAIAYRITNQSGGTSTVAVTITALPLET
jgi:hypothetical protein